MPSHLQTAIRVKPRAGPRALPTVKAARSLFSDSAYRLLKQRIVSNEYPGGCQILEEDMAADLGISRTPLKEALLKLQAEGLVELVPRRGVRVIPLTANDIVEIYSVLEALEDLAVKLLGERDDAERDIAALQADVVAMQAALRIDDLDAWAAADERFHTQLLSASGNSRLGRAAGVLLAQSQRFRMFTLRLRPKPVKSTRNHVDLVKALKDGDIKRARRVHAEQKASWREAMSALLNKFKITQI